MIQTTQEYQRAIRKNTRSTVARIIFGVVDVTANSDALPSANTSQPFTTPLAILEEKRNPEFKMATFEQDYFKLDGSFYLVPDDINTDDKIGWWSSEMSDEDCLFDIDPIITIDFDDYHSSLGLGLFFGTDDYCTDFEITWYDGNTVLDSAIIVDNERREFNLYKPVDNYNKIVIKFLKTKNPFRYARLMEIQFGLEESFDSNDITQAKIVEQISPISNALPYNTLSFTVINKDQKFNMLNPEGIYAYLQGRQKIKAFSGLLLPDGTYEEVPMGEFYLSSWKNSTGLTASLDATDIIGVLDKMKYISSPFWVNEPIENVLNHILTDSGIRVKLTVMPSVESEVINGYIPVKSHREAILDVLVASRAYLRKGRDGSLVVDRIKYNQAVDEINYDLIIGTPTIEQRQLITSVEATEFSYELSSDKVEIYSTSIIVVGEQEVLIEFGVAALELEAIVTNGTIVGEPIFSATTAKITIQASGEVTILILGKQYIESSRKVVASVGTLFAGEVPQSASVAENKLIVNNGYDVALHTLNYYYKKRIKQTIEFWDNPSLEAGDCVDVETLFTTYSSGIVERHDITFAPRLRGRIEVIG